MFVLDTDHLSLLQRDDPTIVARVRATPPSDLAVTVVSFEEQLGAWYTQIRQAKSTDKLARAYDGLYRILEDVRRLRILPFSPSAIDRYLRLRQEHRRIGKMDLSIAAIVLEYGGILVTRNRRDFEPISGLPLEDWRRPAGDDVMRTP